MKGVKIRLSRTLCLVLGGVVLLGGGSGALALYIGSDRLLGPSYLEVNGLQCTTLQLVKIKRDGHYWVRKYVFTDRGDGPARLKTALRVAKSVQAAEKADLVQISVLDKSGPTLRAGMRGRAIGAQVVYIPTPSKDADVPEPVYSAFYFEGPASAKGEYFGTRIEPTLGDIEKIAASLTDKADCVSPVIETQHKDDGHGAPKGKKKAKGGGHDAAADAHGGGDAGHGGGAEKPAEGHGGTPVAGDGDKPAAGGGHGGEGGAPAEKPEGGGLISSLKSMVFGSPAPQTAAADTQSHGAGSGPAEPGAAHAADAAKAAPSAPEQTAAAEAPGLFARAKAMIFGSDAPKPVVEPAAHAPAGTPLQGEEAAAPSVASAPAQDGIDPMKVAAPHADGSHAAEPASVTNDAAPAPKAPTVAQ
ncbi:hypothetical protein [Rhizobium sp. SGZ-381]|uniref:hypothetical protein n=1 Tax=Rhizobium sp. SGZ-381 TaxID=3342800 RepID=UPI003670F6B2